MVQINTNQRLITWYNQAAGELTKNGADQDSGTIKDPNPYFKENNQIKQNLGEKIGADADNSPFNNNLGADPDKSKFNTLG